MGQGHVDGDQRVARHAQCGQPLGGQLGAAAAAAHEHVGLAQCLLQFLGADGLHAALLREVRRPPGGGVDLDVLHAAFTQQRQGHPGVGSGAKEHHFLVLPGAVGLHQVIGQVQGHGDHGLALGAQCGLGTDVLGGAGGRFKEAGEVAGGGLLLLGLGQGAAHLSGDFAFTDHGAVQSRAHGEEVVDDSSSFEAQQLAVQQVGGYAAVGGELVDQFGGRGERGGDIGIDFEPVAGG